MFRWFRRRFVLLVIVDMFAHNQIRLLVRGAFIPAFAYGLPNTKSQRAILSLQHLKGRILTYTNIELSRFGYHYFLCSVIRLLICIKFVTITFLVFLLKVRDFCCIPPRIAYKGIENLFRYFLTLLGLRGSRMGF